MQLRHLKTLMPPADGMCRVTALCFSPNNARLAVVTVDKVVHLFDETGERRDKFATKPGDKVRGRASAATARGARAAA
jgi:intraflagellar transport protein 172